MQAGDRVYYLHKNAEGLETRFPAVVLRVEDRTVQTRIGRLDVHMQQIRTAEYPVGAGALIPRTTPCNYEEELAAISDD